MVRFASLLIFCLLCLGCAQIGSITGGSKDTIAPRIKGSNPMDGALNVQTRQIEIEFDEFVALQKPNENIVLLPSNVSYETRLVNKTLFIDLEQELEVNTTYSLYLNEAVKDITEGNDTLIQLVFSTGFELDSNEVFFQISDAYTNAPIQDATVGLFDSLAQNKPIYFSKTNEKGFAKLRAIADGSYFYAVFLDENKNNISDADEAQFATMSPIHIDTNYTDTLHCKLSIPLMKKSPTQMEFIASHILALRKPSVLSFDEFYANEVDLTQLPTTQMNDDSIHYYLPTYYESLQVAVDTLKKKVRNEYPEAAITSLTLVKKFVLLPDSCCVRINFDRRIDSVKNEGLRIFLPVDSSLIALDLGVLLLKNALNIELGAAEFDRAILKIDSGAIIGINGSVNEAMDFVLQRKNSESLGDLNVAGYSSANKYFISLFKSEKLIDKRVDLTGNVNVSFNELIPGDYDVFIVEDKNNNGIWDPFDPETYTAPEKRFSLGRKVRVKANFEHEIEIRTPE
ncbi:MAG: Ig-like domain-containing protein [Crocinitomicaceae bacterium]|nr:Ig-like domain-containing protein [Crocinitomicaceae bacterium]MDG1734665.1 Ig-like domain-containing protein [Crocinitomicaceae bacterium]MDG2505604.1 Ig-like domain-containing protein [Crocinitomicaceae bacterium]